MIDSRSNLQEKIEYYENKFKEELKSGEILTQEQLTLQKLGYK